MKQKLLIIVAFVFVAVTVWGASRRQDIRNRAQSPACPDRSASCRWESSGSGVRYRYLIRDVTARSVVAEGETTTRWVRFTPVVDHVYRCEVTPVNACGAGPTSQTESLCALAASPMPSQTPSPTITPTPTTDPFLRSKFFPTDVPAPTPSQTRPTSLPGAENLNVEPQAPPPPSPTATPTVVDYTRMLSQGTNALTYILLVFIGLTIGYSVWQKLMKRKK